MSPPLTNLSQQVVVVHDLFRELAWRRTEAADATFLAARGVEQEVLDELFDAMTPPERLPCHLPRDAKMEPAEFVRLRAAWLDKCHGGEHSLDRLLAGPKMRSLTVISVPCWQRASMPVNQAGAAKDK
jgi:hypothetical protein